MKISVAISEVRSSMDDANDDLFLKIRGGQAKYSCGSL